jgi:hypothetical protein
MKRLLALTALLLAASACTTTTDTNTGAGNSNANTNANAAAASPTPAGPTQADIEARERAIYDAIKSKNWDAFAAPLADDFTYVSPEGVANKAQTLEGIKKYDLTEYAHSDVRFLKVDADLAVIVYTSNEKGSYDGKPTPGKPVRNSSAWVNRGGKWLNVYHQETESAETPAASPSAATSASPAASPATAASPAASPAAPASATDAEKAVWEAIKTKNTDLFASYILPEALEVEPEGVFDKATQVKMITSFDASKFTQSDFKETKLDADVTLVTYTVKGPMAGKTVTEHHSTLWTNRAGQWRAIVHQGSRQPDGERK